MAPPPANEADQASDDANARVPGRLREVAGLFTLLGFTAFGGPAAHIALMEDQVVRRRRWLDRKQFLHLVAAINFIPGPNSTELAIQLGLNRAGFRGMIVAGACFILPAVSIILPLAWLYVHWGQQPRVLNALTGINACVVAIVAAALCRFARTGIKDRFSAAVAVVCAAAAFAAQRSVGDALRRFTNAPHRGIGSAAAPLAAGAYAISRALAASQPEIILLAFAGILGALWYGRHESKPLAALLSPGPFHLGLPAATVTTVALGAALLAMSLFFLKVGATLFGSGYVLVSYLRTGLVEQHHWLTERQLLDAIAVGQVTPGPLLTTATFIGYVLGDRVFGGGVWGGIAGGLLATLSIFLPSFIFVAMLGRILPRLQRSPLVRGALDAMNAAVVALILVVTVRLGAAALHGLMTWAIALVTLGALLIGKINATWLLLGAALAGWVIQSG
jgi:chromate transporter